MAFQYSLRFFLSSSEFLAKISWISAIRKSFTVLLILLIIFSISLGIMLLGTVNIHSNPLDRETKKIEMKMNNTYSIDDNVEYIESDNNNLIIEADVIKGTNFNYYIEHLNTESKHYSNIHLDSNIDSPIDFINVSKNFIKNGVFNEDNFNISNIKVYTNKENIEVLKNNKLVINSLIGE